jgi:FixJ family two-component response regulator
MGAATATIAVIEDDFAVRNALMFSLQADGLSVRGYESAEDALRDTLLSEIDCFVIDHRLPRMNGLDLLATLRARGIDVPVVLIASAAGPILRASAGAAGAMVIEKPLIGDELFEFIRASLVGGPGATLNRT